MSDRIVTVIVGPNRNPFYVHERILSSRSMVFRDHFNPRPPTAPPAGGHDGDGGETKYGAGSAVDQEPVMALELPDEDPKLVCLFIRWLYGTALHSMGESSGGSRIFRFSKPDGVEVTVRD